MCCRPPTIWTRNLPQTNASLHLTSFDHEDHAKNRHALLICAFVQLQTCFLDKIRSQLIQLNLRRIHPFIVCVRFVCLGVDLLGPDISSQGSTPPSSTPGPQARWDEMHDFSACATSSWSTADTWFQETYASAWWNEWRRWDPTRILHQPGPARKRIDLPWKPIGLICNETGQDSLMSLPRLSLSLVDVSQCSCLHKHNSAILPCKKIHGDTASTAM